MTNIQSACELRYRDTEKHKLVQSQYQKRIFKCISKNIFQMDDFKNHLNAVASLSRTEVYLVRNYFSKNTCQIGGSFQKLVEN